MYQSCRCMLLVTPIIVKTYSLVKYYIVIVCFRGVSALAYNYVCVHVLKHGLNIEKGIMLLLS
jgi:hypothetical protein